MSVVNAASLIQNFSETITVRHYSAGTIVNGIVQPGGVASVVITDASVQPVSGEDLQSLPELERTKEALKVYTTAEVQTSDPRTGIPSDLVGIRGNQYKAVHVEPWAYGFIFYKVLCVREKE